MTECDIRLKLYPYRNQLKSVSSIHMLSKFPYDVISLVYLLEKKIAQRNSILLFGHDLEVDQVSLSGMKALKSVLDSKLSNTTVAAPSWTAVQMHKLNAIREL